MNIAVVVMPLFFVLVVLIPVLIGIYVYRDAKKRNMNAALWTIVAVFAPSLIGLIIYLIVRGDHSALLCPQCKAPVAEQYAVCPVCGAQLKNKCEKCGYTVEPEWKICPNCAQTLPENMQSPVAVQRKDKGLGRILLIVIAVPVLLCLLLVASLVSFRTISGSVSTTEMTLPDTTVFEDNGPVKDWLAECEAGEDGVYVLRHERSDNQGEYEFLIYFKGVPAMTDMRTGYKGGSWFSKPALQITYSGTPIGAETENDPADYNLSYLHVISTNDRSAGLEIVINGEDVSFIMTETTVSLLPTVNDGFKG